MEYFLGSLLTLITSLVVAIGIGRTINLNRRSVSGVMYSQSRVFFLMQPFIPSNKELAKPIIRQSIKHNMKIEKRVIIMDKMAYWIQDNNLYTADVIGHDEVKKDTARVVDTMALDKVQLDKISFIVDKLTEGLPNESGDSRNP